MRRSSVRVSILAVCFLLSAWLLAGAVTGDFNGDGKLDVLLVYQCSPTPCSNSTITVRLGRGDGRFRAPITTTSEGFPGGDAVVVGNFNSDHKLDIAFLSLDSRQRGIAVVLGNGDGSFGPTTLYPYQGGDLLGGDVNGDGKFDLVVSNAIPGVFLGNGDGTFSALPDAPGAHGCVLADVNHDGKLDVLGNSISLGNGDGTFRPAQDITGGGNCPAIADLNGDGNLDVAALVRGGINLYLGNGDGTFLPPVYKWLFPGEHGILLTGDFNGDGATDMLATRATHIDIVLNAGRAKFRPAVGYLRPSDILGDFNADGRTDAVILRASAPVTAALSEPDGTLTLPRSYWFEGGGASILPGEVNGDGKLDLIEMSQRAWQEGHVNRLIGNGDGTFKVQQSLVLTSGKAGRLVGVADQNRDGKLDVVTTLDVLLGLGNGLFQTPTRIACGGAGGPIADFNGDGVLDIAVDRRILLGNGDGTFGCGANLPAYLGQLVAGDFNHDGKQDLATAGFNQVGIMLGNGDGTFQPISVLRKGYVGSLLAADFNSDGNLDVAGVGTNSSGAWIASVYLGTGAAALQDALNTWITGCCVSWGGGAVAADFDGDARPDLAVSLSSGDGSGETAILFGSGTGRFGSRSLLFGGGFGLVAGDFDANGSPDLAVVTSGNTVAVPLRQP